MGIIAGIVMFAGWILLGTWWFPFIFNLLKGLFENPDVGTVVGLVGIVLTVGPFAGLMVACVMFTIGFVHEFTK